MNAEGYPIDNEPRMECALLFFLGNFVGSRTGAMLRKFGLSVSLRFL